MTLDTTSQSFFEKIYQTSEDPWGFASSDYERDRYATIMRALRGRAYRNTFELACSVGVLTTQLALISEQVHAIDISPTAITRAHERCRAYSNVSVSCGRLPTDIPTIAFDLIVFSEIGYYFNETGLAELARKLVERLEPNGIFLAAHWLGNSPDHILSGDRVHEILKSVDGLELEVEQCYSCFRLDRWARS
jgi:protein-L-isoaspartate O-methyltransferase